MYDVYVQRRQDKVLATANKTNAIVKSLFPKNVRDRMMAEAEELMVAQAGNKKIAFSAAPKSQLKSFLNDEQTKGGNKGADTDNNSNFAFDTKPIADLFPRTTGKAS